MKRTLALFGVSFVLAIAAGLVGRHPAPAQPGRSAVVPTDAPPPVRNAPVAARDGSLDVNAKLWSSYVRSGGSETFVAIDLTGMHPETPKRTPVNLAIVIDRSGSMSGAKIDRAKRGARQLVSQLRRGDRLAIVDYAADVRLLPSTSVEDGLQERAAPYIEAIAAGGNTDIGAALEAASRALSEHIKAYRASRIVLITDGVPTAGMLSRRELTGVAARLRGEGLTVSAVGVGADFDENMLTGIAGSGGGLYGYLRDGSDIAGVFERELQNAASQVARDVTVSLEPAEGVEVEEIFGRDAVRRGHVSEVRLYDFSAGIQAQVIARLNVEGGEGGFLRPIVQVRVAYADLEADRRVTSLLPLSATVTSDEREVLAHRDVDVAAAVVRAQGSKEMARAAETIRGGDKESGLFIMDNLRALFATSANELAGDDSLRREAADLDRIEHQVSSARSAADLDDGVKKLGVKRMASFGSTATAHP